QLTSCRQTDDLLAFLHGPKSQGRSSHTRARRVSNDAIINPLFAGPKFAVLPRRIDIAFPNGSRREPDLLNAGTATRVGLEVSPGSLLQDELIQRQIRDRLAQPASSAPPIIERISSTHAFAGVVRAF